MGERARVYGSERAILVGLNDPGCNEAARQESMQELESLAYTADISTIAWVVQSRPRPDPAFFIGQGKVDELRGMAEGLAADVIIFNSELSPAQARNLEERLSRKVIDRAQLIMDIFAQRAMTKEARLQVELAQLRYLSPRLRGWGEALTRLGGGIGTRGPGETQLELDRDKIKRRIHTIKQRLIKAEKERALRRKRRKANPIPKVVLVGYTNSGKSTLLNRLCEAGSPVGDKLFATLSIVVRRGGLQRGRKALFIDTVGFITDLPHHLIPAFAATLEAVRSADLLLHVVDLGNPRAEENHRTVLAILNREVFFPEDFRPPMLNVLNKVDLAGARQRGMGFPDSAIRISARHDPDLGPLTHRIGSILFHGELRARLLVPYPASDVAGALLDTGKAIIKEYREDGAELEAQLSREELARLRKRGVRVLTPLAFPVGG